MMTDPSEGAQWADRALARLAPVRPGQGFEAGLLAAYDGWNRRRSAGWLAAMAGALRSLCGFIWPGVPAWAPAGAFAASLLLGAALGIALPAMDNERMGAFSLDQPPSFSLAAPDTDEDM
jgi:hypothetical protein